MQPILTALKDIQGVVGSFVLADHGDLVSREMPSLYPDNLFPEIGRRLHGVSGALETQKGPYTEMLLKFDSYWLLSRRTPSCSLNIMTMDSVNYPALRMATNVVLKQIEEHIAASPIVRPPITLASPAALQAESLHVDPAVVDAVPAETVAPEKKRRMWRGQYVD